MREFVRIRRAVEGYKERWHWWHVPAALIAGVQGFIFGFCIEPLLRAAGIPKFIFACAGVNWTGLYLSISAAANAIFRLAMWQLCDHEIVNSKSFTLHFLLPNSNISTSLLSLHRRSNPPGKPRLRNRTRPLPQNHRQRTPSSLSTSNFRLPHPHWQPHQQSLPLLDAPSARAPSRSLSTNGPRIPRVHFIGTENPADAAQQRVYGHRRSAAVAAAGGVDSFVDAGAAAAAHAIHGVL